MPMEIVFVAEEAPEGGYTARALGVSIFTEADTLEALRDFRATSPSVILPAPPARSGTKSSGRPAAISD